MLRVIILKKDLILEKYLGGLVALYGCAHGQWENDILDKNVS